MRNIDRNLSSIHSRRVQGVIWVDPVPRLRDEFYLREYVIIEANSIKYILSPALTLNNPSESMPSTNQFDNHHGIVKGRSECIFVLFLLNH